MVLWNKMMFDGFSFSSRRPFGGLAGWVWSFVLFLLVSGNAWAGTRELDALRSAVEADGIRGPKLDMAGVLDGLTPEQTREALLLLTHTVAPAQRLREVLSSLSEGDDKVAELAAYRQIELAHLSGELQRVYSLSDAFRLDHPGSAFLTRTLLLSGWSALEQRKLSLASERFLQVLLRAPSSPEAREAQVGLGDCYRLEERFDEALAQYSIVARGDARRTACRARLRLVEIAVERDLQAESLAALRSFLGSCEGGILQRELEKRWPKLVKLAQSASPDDSGSKTDAGAETRYWVQLGAYRKLGNAQRLVSKLSPGTKNLTVHETEVSGEAIFKVCNGPYPSEKEALTAQHSLEEELGLLGFVIRLPDSERRHE